MKIWIFNLPMRQQNYVGVDIRNPALYRIPSRHTWVSVNPSNWLWFNCLIAQETT